MTAPKKAPAKATKAAAKKPAAQKAAAPPATAPEATQAPSEANPAGVSFSGPSPAQPRWGDSVSFDAHFGSDAPDAGDVTLTVTVKQKSKNVVDETRTLAAHNAGFVVALDGSNADTEKIGGGTAVLAAGNVALARVDFEVGAIAPSPDVVRPRLVP